MIHTTTTRAMKDAQDISTPSKASSKNSYGQYFTPKEIAEFMVKISAADTSSRVLEPCSGEGVFVRALQKLGFRSITACEIDPKLAAIIDFVRCESFVSAQFDNEFDLIIGDPPYIRWANLEQELKEELKRNELWQRYCNSWSCPKRVAIK